MRRTILVALGLGLTLAVASSAFFGGMLFERHLEGAAASADPRLGRVIEEVQGLLELQALDPSDDASMTAGAIQGLLDSLGDPYAQYLDERHFTYFNEQNEGEFGGIGVSLAQKDGQTVIVEVMPDTPASGAGLEPEDIIYGIEGERRDTWDIDAVVGRVRGPEGTPVTIEVKREGADDPLEFTMVRARIELENVTSRMIGDDVGYVQVGSFNAKSSDEVAGAVRDLEGQGANGFILDLRNNPGGMLGEAVEMSSLFIKDGVIVSVEYRERPSQEYRAAGGHVTDKPVVVLVNENSASASEILAGAVQDTARGKLVGVTTFGKGSVQTVEQLAAGGGVKFTIARYLTPKGRSIDKTGLTPDVVVEMEPELAADEKTDTQLAKALEVLRRAL